MRRPTQVSVLSVAFGVGLFAPLLVRAQGDGLQRIRQDIPYSYAFQVMENGQSKDLTAEFNRFLESNRAEGVVFHTRTHPVTESPLGDRRVELDLGGKGQLIQITELSPQAIARKHRYGLFGEPIYLVVQGQGRTKYTTQEGMEREVQWSTNDLFAVPPGSWIEHSLPQGASSARLLEYVGYGINVFRKEDVEVDRGSSRRSPIPKSGLRKQVPDHLWDLTT